MVFDGEQVLGGTVLFLTPQVLHTQYISATAEGNALRMLLTPHSEIIHNSDRHDSYFDAYYLHVLNIQMDVYEQTGDKPILYHRHLSVNHFLGLNKLKAIANNALSIYALCKINKWIHKIWRSH